MADTFELAQITFSEEAITAINAAIIFLTLNPTKRYTLDTGQSRQEVSRQELEQLKALREALLSERDTMKTRCFGKPIINAPGW